MACHLSTPLILLSLAFDVAFGDPAWLPHPVRLIGLAVNWGERRWLAGEADRDLKRGAVLASVIVAATALGTWLVISTGERLDHRLGILLAVGIAWTTLALRGLDRAASEVAAALKADDYDGARRVLPALVGRDPAALGGDGIIRATVESLAENSSDGVVAPLFYLFVGGPAAAMAYKAINTLDSMIGFRDRRYLYFGRFAARLDDLANFVPARLTALSMIAAAALALNRGRAAFNTCRADAQRHASPNAGFPEAAVAGALGIRLGGDAVYNGVVEARAELGRSEHEPKVEDIQRARRLMWLGTIIALLILAVGRAALRIR